MTATPAQIGDAITAVGIQRPDQGGLVRLAAWMAKHQISLDRFTSTAIENHLQLDPFVHQLLKRDDLDAHHAAVALCWAMSDRMIPADVYATFGRHVGRAA